LEPWLYAQQGVTVTAKLDATSDGRKVRPAAVLWLVPLSVDGIVKAVSPSAHPQLLQKNKQFHPHLLVVPAGSSVDFPNRDPFFHNVFSLFEGKRFDLGLYEAGTTRKVRFDRPGISYIFCNIHPQMSAVVISLTTPYYSVADSTGQFNISGVPAGHYRMESWVEGASADVLNDLSREVNVIEDSLSLGTIRVSGLKTAQSHLNKYGREYEPPPATSPYDH
jgi:plastocyanin